MTNTSPQNDGNGLSVRVRKPVWFKVRGLRELLKTNNITERRNGHLYRCRQTKLLFR
jgi:hypothetical protein